MLVFDLNVPNQLITNAESLISAVRDRVDWIKEETSGHLRLLHPIYEKESQTSKHGQNRFPVPLLLVGSKYDLFQVI